MSWVEMVRLPAPSARAQLAADVDDILEMADELGGDTILTTPQEGVVLHGHDDTLRWLDERLAGGLLRHQRRWCVAGKRRRQGRRLT